MDSTSSPGNPEETHATRRYTITPRDADATVKRHLRRTLPALLFCFAAIAGMLFHREILGERPPAIVTIIVTVVAIAASLWMLVHGIRINFRKHVGSFTIDLGDKTISRHYGDTAHVSIGRDDISEIRESPLGITLRGIRSRQTIFVPKGTNEYDEIRSRLSAWQVVETSSRWVSHPVMIVLALLFYPATMVSLFLFDRAEVVVPLAILITIVTTWLVLSIYRRADASAAARRNTWYIVLPAVVALLRVVQVLLL